MALHLANTHAQMYTVRVLLSMLIVQFLETKINKMELDLAVVVVVAFLFIYCTHVMCQMLAASCNFSIVRFILVCCFVSICFSTDIEVSYTHTHTNVLSTNVPYAARMNDINDLFVLTFVLGGDRGKGRR